jgi:GTPase SAR1 family protein
LDGYDDEYILFDCPGQIELYTHMNIMQKLVEQLQRMDFRICAVFILDSHFASDLSKYFSGVLVALSTIVNMEVSSINIFSKVDLLNRQERRRLDQFLEPTSDLILAESTTRHGQKFQQLNLALAKLIDDYALVKFFPLDINDEENLGDIMLTIDNAIQWGEDADVKIPKDPEEQDEADEQEHN